MSDYPVGIKNGYSPKYPVVNPTSLHQKDCGKPSQSVGWKLCICDGHRPYILQVSWWGRDCKACASWNMRSMTARSGEVVETLSVCRVDICFVQDSRWMGSEIIVFGKDNRSYKFFCKAAKMAMQGLEYLFQQSIYIVIDVRRINERLMTLKVLLGKKMVSCVSSAYALQLGRIDQERDIFWV